MPVLARVIEASGIPTVIVTMMPVLAEKHRLARIVGVEFPFGHPFGMPGDAGMQRQVLLTALGLLESAGEPLTRVDVDIAWPVDRKTAYKSWQPAEPSPIVKASLEAIRAARREAEERG